MIFSAVESTNLLSTDSVTFESLAEPDNSKQENYEKTVQPIRGAHGADRTLDLSLTKGVLYH
jgi:hypothetical protein